jgi:hypothetical protein
MVTVKILLFLPRESLVPVENNPGDTKNRMISGLPLPMGGHDHALNSFDCILHFSI